MALRGKIPSKVEKRFKGLFYGVSGSGKTTCSLQFPKPYFIDTEKGATNDQYIDLLVQGGGNYFFTQDFDDLEKEVKELANVKHDYQTLVIDPITNIYNNLLERCEKSVGSSHGKHYGEANKKFKRLIDLLLRLDMNIVITSHTKNEYGDKLVVLGQTFDAYKKLDYLFDLVIEVKATSATKRMGTVRKSRITTFPLLEEFEFSYPVLSAKYDKKMLEKSSVPLNLITDQTLSVLKETFKKLNYSGEQIDRLLSKKNLSDLSELTEAEALAFIDKMKTKEEKENV
jgi:hypothetical protein